MKIRKIPENLWMGGTIVFILLTCLLIDHYVIPKTKVLSAAILKNTPTPTEEIITPTEVPIITNTPILQNTYYTESQSITKNNPLPTTDPDPIIACSSKTGQLQVRKSVCSSNTDCPDGYGGYIFESQDSCKARWDKISNDLKNTVNAHTQAIIDRSHLQSQELQIEQTQSQAQTQEYMNQAAAIAGSAQAKDLSNLVPSPLKIIDAAPTPTQGFANAKLNGTWNY